MTGPDALPDGVLVAWYGDDFTGSAAVMEVLTFAGLDSVLFFEVPTPAQLARFAGFRGIGIAGAARSESPAWMEEKLPPIFSALARLEAPVSQYKICSTFDSAPELGSIGKAVELAAPHFPASWYPLLPAAPAIHRYQAFGNLFASVTGIPYRLDRHPTMSRHPATPMREADVRLHLARQTSMSTGLVDLVAMKGGRAAAALADEVARGARIVALDVVDDETLRAAGSLIWGARGPACLAVGSQGVEYALVAHWRAAGLLPDAPGPFRAERAERMAVVSGSCSPATAGQIDWAADHGFAAILVDAVRALDPQAWSAEIGRATDAALRSLSEGRDPILFTARGPDDPRIAAFNDAVRAGGLPAPDVNRRVGEGLGQVLADILRRTGITRAAIAGGDTSSHGAAMLGIYALTALAPIVPGAALFKAHSEDAALAGLELALKGGQMGPPDFFGRIKAGGHSLD